MKTPTLAEIQSLLKVGKTEFNKDGKYNYRTAEGILEEAKKVLNPYGLAIVLSDKIKEVGGRCYVESKAAIVSADYKVIFFVTGNAAEDQYRKSMDSSQKTGSASSYARKKALEGLFALDDERNDPDREEQKIEPELTRGEKRLKLLIEDSTDLNQLEGLKKTVPKSLKSIFDDKVKELSI